MKDHLAFQGRLDDFIDFVGNLFNFIIRSFQIGAEGRDVVTGVRQYAKSFGFSRFD